MERKKNLSPRSRGNSFIHAFNGFKMVMKEPNAMLHAAATGVVLAAGFIRHLDRGRWIAIIFAIGLVWVAEAINTGIELLCDYSCDNELHPSIKVIKDIGAAAVLMAAITSAAVGIIVFFF